VQLSSLSCGQPCAGNTAQRCGGWPGQSSVYRSDVGDNTTQTQGYLGCWQETTPKAVQGFGQWLDGQSVDSCRAICSAKNFALSGLSNGKRKSLVTSHEVWLTIRMLVRKFALFSLEPNPFAVLRKPMSWQYRSELWSVE